MKKILLAVLITSLCYNVSYAHNEWVPYIRQPSPPVVYVPSVPQITYTTPDYIPIMPRILTYEWVPYYSYRNIVVEKHGLICQYRTVIQQPYIEWVYQRMEINTWAY